MKLGSTSFAVLYKARTAFSWTSDVLVATRCKLEHAAHTTIYGFYEFTDFMRPRLFLDIVRVCARVRVRVCFRDLLSLLYFAKFVLLVTHRCLFLRRTTVFSHAQTTVICQECNSLLCQPTGGKARLTDGCSFRPKTN